MIERVSFIFFILSFIGLVIILVKKAPLVANLPNRGIGSIKRDFFLLKDRIISYPFIKNFSWNKIFQIALSRVRVITLKVEKSIDKHLHSLRKKNKIDK